MLANLLSVMAGGAAGALSRYLMVRWVTANLSLMALPVGTLAVNVLGSLVIGILAGVLISRHSGELMRLFAIVGFLGSFTTVSSFSLETTEMLLQSQHLKAFLNIAATMVLCITATWAGLMLSRFLQV